MATDRALLRRRRVFAAEIEATTGTDAGLIAGGGAMNVFDRDLTPAIEMTSREAQGGMSMLPAVPGARQGTMNITTHLHGNGATGVHLWCSTLLAASGWTDTASTFAPDSTNDATITAGLYEDGALKTLTGCKTDWTMTFRAGQPVEINWTITGKYIEPQAVAIIAPTLPTVIPPRFASATLTVAGVTYKVAEMTIAAGNTVVMREDATADDDAGRSNDGTGYHAAQIVNRNVTISMDPEDVALGTKNWSEDWMNGTEAALSVVVGTASNNVVTIAAPQVQVMDNQPGDRGGISTNQLTFQANYASAVDDELTFAFS